MKTFKLMAAAATIAGATALTGASAEAAYFTLVDPTPGVIPDAQQTNEVVSGLGLGASLAGYFGAQISLVGTSPILVEFLGYEAGYRNTFTLDGGSFSTEIDDGTPSDNKEIFSTPPSFYTGPLSGLIPFVFATGGGGTPASAVNGSNPTDASDGPTGVNFFASFVGTPTATSGRSLMLFFDDNGGNNDDNHDDMVVRLSVAPVPVPASLPLLLGALSGLTFLSRRKRAYAG
jgi:hypothetical protein